MKSFLTLALVVVLPMCQSPEPKLDTGLEGYSPDLVDTQRVDCESRGGRFGQGGITGRFVCFEETQDAGQTCSAAGDCESICLARSRSCSPIKPFFGCQDVLTASGARATLCVD